MDKKIRLISLKEHNVVAIYKEHKTGVRRLSYCHLYNSTIASVGHENYINLWSPEISLHKAYIGRLEGHNSTVVDAQFTDQTPFLISLDIKENIRIWDIRSHACLQIITRNSNAVTPPEYLVLFPYQRNKFCISGKKLITYTNESEVEQDEENKGKQKKSLVIKETSGKDEDSNICVAVHFNYYLFLLMIVTHKDIRLYDPANGTLSKVYNDFLKSK